MSNRFKATIGRWHKQEATQQILKAKEEEEEEVRTQRGKRCHEPEEQWRMHHDIGTMTTMTTTTSLHLVEWISFHFCVYPQTKLKKQRRSTASQ